jgi:response regulator RpfG family c-di-GMP phosphodiesterase
MKTLLSVLLVQESEAEAEQLVGVLRASGYDLRHEFVGSADRMVSALDRTDFDLVIADYSMRCFSAMKALAILQHRHLGIPVIVIADALDGEAAVALLKAGACDFITKGNLSRLAPAIDRELREAEERTQAEKALRESREELWRSREETIVRLARAAGERDDESGWHIQRMSHYCALIAHRAGLSSEQCEQIRVASIMHDVGKIGIPDSILLKPGPLTAYEFNIMKRHTEIGHHILIGSKAELLKTADAIAWTHHEKYDGSGYPRGLAADAIPLEGRIAAIADVFDALTSKRVYKPAEPINKAVSIMREGRGKHFDPTLLDGFLDAMDDVRAIREQYADGTGKPLLALAPIFSTFNTASPLQGRATVVQ